MHEVRAEITANVILVRVEVGQRVAEGDELVVLESMKMEIPVLAPVDGIVSQVALAAGATVAEGDLVAIVDDAS
ncbi:MAG: biotin/lipoyl-binding carrier protein [Acidimicrobiia bacterium]|nr:biotin/lipoyl-binding carrier protein [Acidimicrobiia bacterium]